MVASSNNCGLSLLHPQYWLSTSCALPPSVQYSTSHDPPIGTTSCVGSNEVYVRYEKKVKEKTPEELTVVSSLPLSVPPLLLVPF